MANITLTSDIGTQDYIVSAIKGRLLRANSDFRIYDVSHSLNLFNYPLAAYICRNAIKNYPAGTMHLVLVNLFDKRPDYLLIAKHKGHYIACADNGLITMILEELPEEIVALHLDKKIHKNILNITDIFAAAFNEISKGVPLHEIGDDSIDYDVKKHLRPMLGENWMEGQILYIDNFENVIVNITKDEFEQQRKGRDFLIIFKRDEKIEKISESYADVQQGEKVAMFNAAGYLELAVNKGNAAGLFGLESYSERFQGTISYNKNRMIYQTIRIEFEKVNSQEETPHLTLKVSHLPKSS